jgi:MobA-like NTP transferase protein
MAPRTSTNGFILAGGESRRMGRDKATLKWGNASLLDHMVQLLSTVATTVRVVGRGELPDRISGKSPLGGILTELESTERLLYFLRLISRFIDSDKSLCSACRIDGDFPLGLGFDEGSRRISQGG